MAQGGSIALSSSRPTVVWITLYVPPSGNTPGTTTANLVLTPNGAGALTIPVSLYIFNFALSSTGHFKTLMMSQPLRCPPGPIGCSSVAQLDRWKSVYLQHRMAVRNVAWPAGLNMVCRPRPVTLIHERPSHKSLMSVYTTGLTPHKHDTRTAA